MCVLLEFLLREVGFAHIAFAGEGYMECESHLVVLHHVTHLASLEVLAQQWAVNGMSSVLYNLLGTLHWILESQVGYALVGNDDVDAVHGVVDVSTLEPQVMRTS